MANTPITDRAHRSAASDKAPEVRAPAPRLPLHLAFVVASCSLVLVFATAGTPVPLYNVYGVTMQRVPAQPTRNPVRQSGLGPSTVSFVRCRSSRARVHNAEPTIQSNRMTMTVASTAPATLNHCPSSARGAAASAGPSSRPIQRELRSREARS